MTTRVTSFAAVALAASVLGAFSAAPAQAQVSSSCAGFSDCLLVFDPNHAVVAADSIWVTEAQEAANGPNFIYTSPVAVDLSQIGFLTILTEPGVPVRDGYSDIFGVGGSPSSPGLAFSSDTETALVNFGVGPSTVLPETGAPVSATKYLNPDLQDSGWTATFQSDSDVPEASTWAMLLIGFVGLGCAAFRRGAIVRFEA